MKTRKERRSKKSKGRMTVAELKFWGEVLVAAVVDGSLNSAECIEDATNKADLAVGARRDAVKAWGHK